MFVNIPSNVVLLSFTNMQVVPGWTNKMKPLKPILINTSTHSDPNLEQLYIFLDYLRSAPIVFSLVELHKNTGRFFFHRRYWRQVRSIEAFVFNFFLQYVILDIDENFLNTHFCFNESFTAPKVFLNIFLVASLWSFL